MNEMWKIQKNENIYSNFLLVFLILTKKYCIPPHPIKFPQEAHPMTCICHFWRIAANFTHITSANVYGVARSVKIRKKITNSFFVRTKMVVWSSIFRPVAQVGLKNIASKPEAVQAIVKNGLSNLFEWKNIINKALTWLCNQPISLSIPSWLWHFQAEMKQVKKIHRSKHSTGTSF